MMGREVTCACHWGAETGSVKAQLESQEIILRGEIKRRVSLPSIMHARVDDRGLHFLLNDTKINLAMAVDEAALWLKKIAAPPPTLREKLGLSSGSKALVVNKVTEPVLSTALADTTTSTPADANMVVAMVEDRQQLAAAEAVHEQLPAGSAIWIIHGKGRDARFGETRVREAMRAAGFIDTKVAAVSQRLSATRYIKKT